MPVISIAIAAACGGIHAATLVSSVLLSRWKTEEQVTEVESSGCGLTPSFPRTGLLGRRGDDLKSRKTRARRVGQEKCLVRRREKGSHPFPSLARGRSDRDEEEKKDNSLLTRGEYIDMVERRSRNAIELRRKQRLEAEGNENGCLPPVRILILMSDTGGGHRASALAMKSAFQELWPDMIDVTILDIWTCHSAYPWNTMVKAYCFFCKYPVLWRFIFEIARFPPTRWLQNILQLSMNSDSFARAFEQLDPDIVISMHPLCQIVPLKALNLVGGGKRVIPFVTVVTDLGGAHPLWFHEESDKLFVASKAVMRKAMKDGVDSSRIYQLGLPVREQFWVNREGGESATVKGERETLERRKKLRNKLGLNPNDKVVIIVGGGEGTGIESIGDAVIRGLGEELTDPSQVVIVCGKNDGAVKRLASPSRPWPPKVNVLIKGFINNMGDWMKAVDCIITKAGPGTIAECAIERLPIMLCSYLPGQEEGNIPFVVNGGFGDFSTSPKVIVKTAISWLQDDEKLNEMSKKAYKAARPNATVDICKEIGTMIF